jgi:release factor glutamine methyltransferase
MMCIGGFGWSRTWVPTAADLIRHAAERLAAAGIETARLDAEVLLRHVLGIDRTALFVRLHERVNVADAARFHELIETRLAGNPVAYLTGLREFMELPFAVGPGVLVPRPETELLVEWAANRIKRQPTSLVVDVGTGSGAIVLALAKSVASNERSAFVGSDLSAIALAYAARNRSILGLDARVSLVLGDLLTWLGQPADLILANLPYLKPEQVASTPEIRAEPEIALVAGPQGLDAIARLILDAPRVLTSGGSMIIELDPSQATTVAGWAKEVFPSALVEVIRDLAGFDRFVVVERV